MRKVFIAGASGFIGRALIEHLLANTDVQLVGFSRERQVSHHPRLKWTQGDLFSLKDITEAMEGCEEAFYLVHSMLPSASLSQGRYDDYDVILADNFIRAARALSLKHIIYLGGLVGQEDVEETMKSSGLHCTILRSGPVIGPKGFSVTILRRLIERQPFMLCPNWTNIKSMPVALQGVLTTLTRSLLEGELQGRTYDLGGPEVVTYQELIKKAVRLSGRKRRVFTLNIIPLFLSRWWLSLVTGLHRNLIWPLVLSLKKEALPLPERRWPSPTDLNIPLDSALKEALSVPDTEKFPGHLPEKKDVRSIQRLVLPEGGSAEWVANEYFRWLPQFFSTLVTVGVNEEYCVFYLIDPRLPILILKKSPERSSRDRQLLYVVGGLLASKQGGRGRLEFREVLGRRYVMAALHEFRPSLPWYLYRWTQAIVHLIVMRAFGEHLKWFLISDKKVKL